MDAFNTLIKDLHWDSAHVIIDGARNQPQDWTTYLLEDNIDFHNELNNMVSNSEVEEADQQFTPDVPSDGAAQLVWLTRTQFWTPGCTKLSSLMVRRMCCWLTT